MKRLYTAVLHVLPADVRAAHGAEMAVVFEQVLRDRRRRFGLRGYAAAAGYELCALLHFAWCARRQRRTPPRIDERLLTWPAAPERTLPMRATFLQDIRYGIRLLARTPAVTAACVLTMAVAIGANTAVFSVVHGVVLKPLPFPESDRLVVLAQRTDQQLGSVPPGHFYDWQSALKAAERIAGFAYTQRIVERDEFAERTLGALSVGSVFEVLGRQAREGRTLSTLDDDPDSTAVIVLADGFARRLFGSESPVGEFLRVGGLPFTVVGVMPRDFAFPDYDAQYWVPARFDAQFRQNRDQYFLLAVARLRADTSVQQGQAQLDTVMDAIRRSHPQATQNAKGALLPFKEFVIDGFETRLWVLFGGVVVVLLIACANIANLLLARGVARRREMAVRHALGARSTRLLRQMITESLLLAIVGGAAGAAVGWGLLQLLLAWLPDNLPRLDGVTLDWSVLGFTAGASVACGFIFGLWPALQLSRDGGTEALRHGTRETGRTDHARASLVISQVALSLTLLAGAGLLARSFDNLSSVRPGFAPGGVLTFNVSLPGAVYRTATQRQEYFERAVERLRTVPGVTAVGLSTTLPVAGRGVGAWFNILERPLPADQTPPSVPYRVVTPEYFSTIGIPLRRGRLLSQHDGGTGPRAVVVSEAVERRFWPGESALGKRIYLGAPDNRLFEDAEIVGIVGDVKQTALDEATSEAVYVPHRLMPYMNTFAFAVRTSLEAASLAGPARTQLRQIDAAVPMHQVRSLDEIVAESLAPARSALYLLALFAALALVLAMIGVFGVLSYTVHQRRPELAIRVALGATSQSVLMLVLRQGMRHVAIGIGVGLLLWSALSRYIQGLLFDVTPTDPATLLAVSVLLAMVGLLATYLPGRRATTVDPIAVLRES
jgi:putative ABC transport system permease protein